jgi:hypothetical protein
MSDRSLIFNAKGAQIGYIEADRAFDLTGREASSRMTSKAHEESRQFPGSDERLPAHRRADDHLFYMHFDLRDLSVDEAAVVDLLGWFELSRTALMTSASISAAGTRRTDPACSAVPWRRADDR